MPSEMSLQTQTIRLIEQLERHNILLVEWEHALLTRLGYPLVPNSVSCLVSEYTQR